MFKNIPKKVLLFALLLLLTDAFIEISLIQSSSQFLSSVGASYLPYILGLSTFVSPLIAYLILNLSRSSSRPMITGLVVVVFFLMLSMVVYGLHLHSSTLGIWAHVFLARSASIVSQLVLYAVVGYYLNGSETRVYFPMLVSATEMGKGIACTISLGLVPDLNFERVIYVEALFASLAILVAIYILARIQPHSYSTKEHKFARLESSTLKSPFTFVVAGTTFLFMFILAVADYQMAFVLESRTSSPGELAHIYASIRLVLSVSVIFANFFLPRLLGKHTPSLMRQTYGALLLMAGAIACLTVPSSMVFVVFAVLVFNLQSTFFDPSVETMINTSPVRNSGSLRMVVDGITEPAAAFLASGVVLAVGYFFAPEVVLTGLSGIVLLVACIYLAFSFQGRSILRGFYTLKLISLNDDDLIRAIQGLGERGNQAGIAPLMSLFSRSESSAVHCEVLEAVGKIGSEEIVPELIEIARSDENEDVIVAAVKALVGIGSYRAHGFIAGELLPSTSYKVRLLTIVDVVKGARPQQVIPSLLHSLHEGDERVQAKVLEALANIHDRKLPGELRPFLDSPIARTKATAAWALFQYKDYRYQSIEALYSLADSADELDKASFLYAAAKIGSRLFQPKVLAMIDSFSDNPYVIVNGAFALSSMRDSRGDELFCHIFKSWELDDIKGALNQYHQLPLTKRIRVLNALVSPIVDHDALHNLRRAISDSSYGLKEDIEFIDPYLEQYDPESGAKVISIARAS